MKAIDKAGDGKLNLTRAEAQLLAQALNSTKLSHYTKSQIERLPTVARKLAAYLAETEPYKYERKTEPKKKMSGFALTRMKDTELQQLYADLDS